MNTNFAQSDPVPDPKPSAPAARRRWYHRVLVRRLGLARLAGGLLLYLLLATLSQTTVEGIPKLVWPASSCVCRHSPASRESIARSSGPPAGRRSLLTRQTPLQSCSCCCGSCQRSSNRPYAAYGWGSRHRVPDFAIGLLCGFMLLSLLVGVLWAVHLIVFDGIRLSGSQALLYGVKWLAWHSVSLAYRRNSCFRGYLQYTLAHGFAGLIPKRILHRYATGFGIAAILFGAGHSSHSTESLIGLVLGWIDRAFVFPILSGDPARSGGHSCHVGLGAVRISTTALGTAESFATAVYLYRIRRSRLYLGRSERGLRQRPGFRRHSAGSRSSSGSHYPNAPYPVGLSNNLPNPNPSSLRRSDPSSSRSQSIMTPVLCHSALPRLRCSRHCANQAEENHRHGSRLSTLQLSGRWRCAASAKYANQRFLELRSSDPHRHRQNVARLR